MRAIIMADGIGDRWLHSVEGTEFEGIPKQLIEINGETLIGRTVRLLSEYEVSDIWITSHNSNFEISGAKRYEPENNTHCLDKLHACKPIWKSPTMFLYGDVWYSRTAMVKIINTKVKDKFLFFGRMHTSYYTKHRPELFCKKIEDFDYLEDCIDWIKQVIPDYGGGWELYRRMAGVDDGEKVKIYTAWHDHFVSIDDFTDDFDDYNDYITWTEAYYN